MNKREMMARAIELSEESVKAGGGPFGAVIARNGEIIAEAANRVTIDCDPTAHAEVQAIRSACAKLGHFELKGCVLYTSCEPCPMCLGAIYWARLDRVVYAGTQTDAAEAGFDDSFIYKEIALPMSSRSIPFRWDGDIKRLEPFDEWRLKSDKVEY